MRCLISVFCIIFGTLVSEGDTQDGGIYLKTNVVFNSLKEAKNAAYISIYLVNKSDVELRFPLGRASEIKEHRHQKQGGITEVVLLSFSTDWIDCNGKTMIRIGDSELNAALVRPNEAVLLRRVLIRNWKVDTRILVVYEVTSEFGRMYSTWSGRLETYLNHPFPSGLSEIH